MPRAHRVHVPGYVWHLTHRCHRRQFLLQFARDRRLWRHWLYDARRRYGLCVLDYTATCNHIHLLARDQGRDEIAASMQLIEGRTAQPFNQRKARRGAFWQDRYHATAVQTGEHLACCLVYIDLNMVRAGGGEHPATPDTVTIMAAISVPVANAGPDQNVGVGASVQLDGSGSSDPNALPLTYAWTLITRPVGSAAVLSSPSAVKPTFVADVGGTYVAQLIVNDGVSSSAPDTVTIATAQLRSAVPALDRWGLLAMVLVLTSCGLPLLWRK